MISFIVITKNEEKNIERCLHSILRTKDELGMGQDDHEIICVDAGSMDKTVEIIRRTFSEIKIFQIKGFHNSAMGRNIGAREAEGETLFFIDGDMGLEPGFLKEVLNPDYTLKYDYVSGQVMDVIEKKDSSEARTAVRYKNSLEADDISGTPGGIFLIRRILWEKLGGMRNKYDIGEEIDLGIRAANNKINFIRKKELICRHYTHTAVTELGKKDIWRKAMFLSLLSREHFFDKRLLPLTIKNNLTLVLLLFSVILGIIFSSLWLIIIYIATLLILAFREGGNIIEIFSFVKNRVAFDLSSLYGYILFWPKEYEEIYDRV